MPEELLTILKELSDCWCEKKQLGPLSKYLPGYLALNGLTDGWCHCQDALKDVRALYRDQISAEELKQVNKAINLIDRMIAG